MHYLKILVYSYNKTEGLNHSELINFDFHLVEVGSKEHKLLLDSGRFTTVKEIEAITSVSFLPVSFTPPFVTFSFQPKVAIIMNHKAQSNSAITE